MTDVSGKLSRLLDDPEVRVVVFGLAHTHAEGPAAGAPRLREVVLHLAGTSEPDQYSSWLSDDVANLPMTVAQVRAAFGADVLDDLAVYAKSSPDEVAWQLAEVLPDLVDAVSPGGQVLAASELGRHLSEAVEADDRSAGPFGPQLY
ncbi:hypothetical protein Rhe02_80840 [Rhizocola hellebori]|uniref:Uncharacterized protein n=1 Tax=Rhizocola hellebori TaxID=1392758 RepID=A0A8J3VKY2_9ACTN|nr:YidB family protein [Rhizocola hellebori]GIH10017.1 hypothetical protein Rhe02_80840 [Rhizocola hellebori]